MAITEADVSKWLGLVWTDLQNCEPLICPTCSHAINHSDIESKVCSGCQTPFLSKGWSYGMRRALWVFLAVLGAVAGLALIAEFVITAFTTTWPDNTPPLMRLIPIFGCLVGTVIIFAIYVGLTTHFSPKPDSPQRTLSKLAKRYLKSGDLHRAARFYAELLNYRRIKISFQRGRTEESFASRYQHDF
jgi:hypothetical protein